MKYNTKILREGYLSFFTLALILLVMPVYNWYLPPLMILLVIVWFIESYNDFADLLRANRRYSFLFYIFLVYFLWQTISLLYTSDLKMGLSNLFGRLSLLVFPLVLLRPGKKIRENANLLLKLFVAATITFLVFCFSKALLKSISVQNGVWDFNPHPDNMWWLNYFYGMDLTGSIHPSYLAMYVVLAIFISFVSGFRKSSEQSVRSLWFIAGILLLVSLYFISSRSSFLAILLIIPIAAVYKITNQKKNRAIWIIVFILVFPTLFLFKNNARVERLIEDFSKSEGNKPEIREDRLIVWESAINIFSENVLLGVGIGDVRNELIMEYDRQGASNLSEERLNAHNQFLEVLVEIGIFGFFIFLIMIGYMSYISIAEKNLLYAIFILIMIIFFMFETILYRLAGVSFFSLFSFLLLHYRQEK